MKKLLLVVAMLLAASQVMADVTITAVNEGTFTLADGNKAATIRVDYTGTTNVRAFGLDISVDSNCNFWNIRNFKVGENNGTNNGYGIFPGRFRQFINPANPAWGDANGNSNYNPTPPWADPGTTNTGIGFGTMIVEMGYLGAGDANKPPMSGTLFRADINAYKFEGTAHVTITADTMRGGVVDKDTNATTTATVTYVAANIVFPPDCTTPTDEVGQTTAAALAVWGAQGFVHIVGTPVVDCAHVGLVLTNDQLCINPAVDTLNYTYGVQASVPNVVGMTRAAAKAAILAAGFTNASPDVNGWGAGAVTTVGNVYAQSPAAGTPGCGTAVTVSVVSYPIKDTATTNSIYANWVTMGKPQCWAFPRQCHGDADGKKLGNFWTSSNDLTILKGAISKLQAQIPAGGICASFTHKKLGNFWVSSNDLAVLKAYISKLETVVPVCGTPGVSDPNFWYFCIPTGVTCPAGVTCAPAGTCPNTP